ncbi:MAG: UDP-2,4-diacetamido-2,4,6-trideoxy-beta-L-altropyranose hydrolase [Pseudomonadota bacterium]|nr:UDP-2,4-diacetamido-2,4,6-trideoxy-beta-L-altropyranose hydrolase [Pseudomonadota bacterium]MDP1905966.1 UDP-2,4-diacetamido-2,4,6-trideoxy-beta-L-altropyranose hydrolase [Pseudomonadota bacterium]MDP2351884.1 UDP-2,4-diacetamido-2,4,6-trideoxy-beta-L-altropyranose hydrolase [Pseudomonadota bacterium]MDP2835054.1 UDP-2,4-diacetamido-2,4,6-trideoxy-beta-L-altropyranose hydrolase [Pseudomonadota bacterium]
MKIAFRADASVQIGAGHVMRCLALAGELRRQGAEVCFLCRDLPGYLHESIVAQGCGLRPLAESGEWSSRTDATASLTVLSEKIDWLVVDHYGLDTDWETALRARASRLMVIDDLGRAHDSDLLLDQNILGGEMTYQYRVPPACRCLFGPRYALLRPEFAQQRARLRRRDGHIREVLISFGGSDPSGETTTAMEVLEAMPDADIAAVVVLGPANPRRQELLARFGQQPRLRLIEQTTAMAALMAAADVAIGAGGSTTWERCCLGLPAIVVPVAANQLATTAALARRRVIEMVAGPAARRMDIIAVLTRLLAEPGRCRDLSAAGMKLVDGLGIRRVADAMTAHGGV